MISPRRPLTVRQRPSVYAMLSLHVTPAVLLNMEPAIPCRPAADHICLHCSRKSVCMLPVMSPRHPLAVWQSIVLTILDGTYSAFVVPISIAFEVNLSVWSWVTVLDMIASKLEL